MRDHEPSEMDVTGSEIQLHLENLVDFREFQICRSHRP